MYPSISLLLQTFMMLTLHSLNGVNNTASWFCSRFRLEKLGSTRGIYILWIYILHVMRTRFRYIESVHHQSQKDGFFGLQKLWKMLYPKYTCIYWYYYDAHQKVQKNLSGLFLGLNISIRKPTCRVVITRCERPLTKCLQRFSMTAWVFVSLNQRRVVKDVLKDAQALLRN